MERWSVYEANVQSYRSNMISSQAFLLAVAAIFFGKNIVLELACAALAVIQLWYIWFRVITVRTRVVDFYKFGLAELFDECGNECVRSMKPLEERTYIKNKEIREKVNAAVPGLQKNFRMTRIKLDIILPASFTVMWALIVLFTFV